MRLCAILIAILAASSLGCGIVEELDRGQEIMDAHSAATEDEPEEDAVPAKREGKSGADYWKSARTLTPGEGNSDIVSCHWQGKTQFMKKSDCLNRGGRTN